MSVCESKGSSQSLLPSPAKSWTLTAASLGHSSLASSQPPAGHIRPGTAVLQDKTKGSTQSRHPPFGSVFTAEPGVVAEDTGAGPCGARAQARHVCRPVWGAGPWEARPVGGAGPCGARVRGGRGPMGGAGVGQCGAQAHASQGHMGVSLGSIHPLRAPAVSPAQ